MDLARFKQLVDLDAGGDFFLKRMNGRHFSPSQEIRKPDTAS